MYMVEDGSGKYEEANFMRDRLERLVMGVYGQEPEEAFYLLFIHTLGQLTRSVLQTHDLHRRYGDFQPTSDLVVWVNARFNLQANLAG